MEEEIKNDQQLEEALDETAEQAQETVNEQQANPAIKNPEQGARFDLLRKAREQAEKERDELRQQLERLQHAQQHHEPVPQEESFDVGPDDFVEGKHLKSFKNEINRLKKELEESKQVMYQTTVETTLKSKYKDFDSVVTKENLELLRMQHPELAATLQSSSDLYNKAATAYTMIKNLGLVESKEYGADIQRAKDNIVKPRTISSINKQPTTDSPLGHANAFAIGSKERKQAAYQEMMDAIHGRRD